VSQSSSLQPALHRWWLNTQRAQAFRNLEKRRQSRVIGLILHTPGGLVLAATQIADALRSHPAKVTVFVPHYAMSGGALLALSSDEIVMAPHAVLGPVDPQLGQHAAASVAQSQEVRQWRS
jgi:ClpP class serine protease